MANPDIEYFTRGGITKFYGRSPEGKDLLRVQEFLNHQERYGLQPGEMLTLSARVFISELSRKGFKFREI